MAEQWAKSDGRKALLKDAPEGPVGPDASAGGMLQDYSADFMRLRSVAVAKVQALKAAAGKAEGRTWAEDLRATERALESMDSNRRQVQVQVRLELSGAAAGTRQEWDQRMQEWAREVASFRTEMESAREEHGRRTLHLNGRELNNVGPGGGPGEAGAGQPGAASRSQRRTAHESTGLLEQGTRVLQESVKTMLGSEAVSEEVMTDLAQQRETISGVRGKMRTIGTELTQARQSLTRMIRRAQQNRLVTMSVCYVLGSGILFWLCCFLGLSLQYTALVALVILLLTITVSYLRHRQDQLTPAAGGG